MGCEASARGLLWASETRLSTERGKGWEIWALLIAVVVIVSTFSATPLNVFWPVPHHHCPHQCPLPEQMHRSVTALPSSWMALSSPPSIDFETLLSVARLSSKVFVALMIRFGCLFLETLNYNCSGTSFLSLSRSPEVAIPGLLPGSMVSESQALSVLLLCHVWLLIVQHGCSSASRM